MTFISMKLCRRSAVAVVTATAILAMVLHVYWLDGLEGGTKELLFGDTEWGRDYSEWKFRKVIPGMTEKEVISLLGEPIRRVQYGKVVTLVYAYRKVHRAYSVRGVSMESNIVTGTKHEFRCD